MRHLRRARLPGLHLRLRADVAEALKFRPASAEAMTMDSTSAVGGSTEVDAQLQVAVAQKAKNQDRLQGAQAVQLIENARPLPPDATISIRV